MAETSPYTNDIYTVGWISALKDELKVAMALFDEEHGLPQYIPAGDDNNYLLGEIHGHKLAMACLSGDQAGVGPAAAVAKDMHRTFTNIRLVLLVGIGGGVPGQKDVRLGDVVVSYPVPFPDGGYNGVVQYDYGKLSTGGDIDRKDLFSAPSKKLIAAVDMLEMLRTRIKNPINKMSEILDELGQRFSYPDQEQTPDRLYKEEFIHKRGLETCDLRSCPAENLVPQRAARQFPHVPEIHRGTIASGSMVIKDCVERDRINGRYKMSVLCVEMEAAGLMNNYPGLVIRGISDYADSHKNDDWRDRAIAVACAYAKEILRVIRPDTVKELAPVQETLGAVHQRLGEVQISLAEGQKTQEAAREDQQREKVISWISTLSFADKHADAVASRQDGTGDWLLADENFQMWEQGVIRSLFCHGMPGAGKTVMAGRIIEHLQTASTSPTAVLYAYCRHNERYPVRAFIAAFARQLANKLSKLPKELKELHEVHSQINTLPTTEELITVIEKLAKRFSRVFVIVDAIDECIEDGNTRLDFMHHIKKIKSFASTLVTSRTISIIEKIFEGDKSLEIKANDGDLKAYLEAEMEKAQWLPGLFRQDPALQNQIITRVSTKTNGMFLLARLFMGSLTTKSSVRDLEDALDVLSDKFPDAYKSTMERVGAQTPSEVELAKCILCWIVYAVRPLHIQELQHALAVRQTDKELNLKGLHEASHLVSTCAGLVVIEAGSEIVRLIHQTTVDYFRGAGSEHVKGADTLITSTCLRYLSFEGFASEGYKDVREMERRLGTYALLSYAAENWGHHARKTREEATSEFAAEVMTNKKNLMNAVKSLSASSDSQLGYGQHSGSAVHVAASFGLERVLRLIITSGDTSVNEMDGFGRTPLWRAACWGHESIVRLLLNEYRANPNVSDRNWVAPLELAASGGHLKIVQTLLNNGANANARDDMGQSPLLLAVSKRQTVATIQHGGLVPVESEPALRTQLGSLVSPDKVKVPLAQVLISHGADVNAGNNSKVTPIWMASRLGYEQVVRLLLQHNALVDSRDNTGCTPLWQAASSGYDSIVTALLYYGASVDAKDCGGRSPLWIASSMGYAEVVKVLIAYGANIEASDGGGRTPLWQAANYNREEVMTLLLTNGAHIDQRDDGGRTALWQAASKGHIEAVKLLLRRKANVHIRDSSGRTLHWLAMTRLNKDTSRVILETLDSC